MKTFTTLAACAALVIAGGVAMPQSAQAQANDEVELCRTLVAQNRYPSVGACVSTLRSGPAKICRNYDSGFLAFFNFKSQGECVSFFRSLF